MEIKGSTAPVQGSPATDAAAQKAQPARPVIVTPKAPAVEAPKPVKVAPKQDLRELQAKIAEQLNAYLKAADRDLEFRVDAGTDTTVTTVRRADTGEVVRQFPTEEALAWMARLNAQSGTLLDESA